MAEYPQETSEENVARTGGALFAEGRQFVTFFLAEEVFAFPVISVQEIIRVPNLVHIPLSPRSLSGLANLRGTLLPIVSMRSLFQMETRPASEETRVVVVDVGMPVGFVVDRVSRVVTVEPDKIETVDSIQATVNTELLTGVVKECGDHAMVMMLDVQRMMDIDFKDIAGQRRRERSVKESGASQTQAEKSAEEGGGDEMQLVSFTVNQQEYAFPIERVQEIVRVPDEVSHIPNTASHVLGIINLRSRLLPLVSLRQMFHFQQPTIGEHNRIVVISLDDKNADARGGSVGIVTDQVNEVLRVPMGLADNVPALLSSGENSVREINTICRLNDGKRLVSILDVEALFEHKALKEALAMQQESGQGDDKRDDRRHKEALEDDVQLVVFRLFEEEYGVRIENVQEIIRIPKELTAVPKVSDFIEGMLNLRGSILPVIDLRRRLGLPECKRNDRQRIVVFTMDGVQTGFIVDSVAEVLKISKSTIEVTPNLSEEQARTMGQVANLEKQKRMVLILEPAQLFDQKQLKALKSMHKAA
ncbi:MAG: chemotaxis protein CheW [Magnetococcales bacterium]|nr:chemotaxis protein CheW [Magnetococcales bacterium]